MKVVKRVIVGVLVVALAAGGIYTGLVHVKKNKVTEVPVTSVSNLLTDWYSETTLDGTITTNVSQNINMDKDMIIEKIYVSQGDDVKKGDNLISFDMTLVEKHRIVSQVFRMAGLLRTVQMNWILLQEIPAVPEMMKCLQQILLPAEMEMEICSLLLDQQQRIEAAVIWRLRLSHCSSALLQM